ncbi:cation-transporting P-type ATPase [Sedimenticola hydrogenitrophicus]|uniref:cation-transporting P-type ATPase n=1 Tax=Sedimenticola hydrogenitrophicus TaxID=2967975 RepID=UPI0023B0D877|nr:cation-transporting P-type ATPase [Sedimenticola hydrogenitrophicus]
MTINHRRHQNKHRPDTPASAWHAMAAAAVFESLSTREEGLSATEVERRLARHGPNRLNPPAIRGALARFFDQFRNVLIYVLLVAGAVTTAMGHLVDSGVIFGVVIVNAIIGFIQEGKAERALEAVRNMLSPQAMVVRDGKRFTLPAEQLVPGDLVFIQSGDRVPADLRLFNLRNLHIDEAMLTGESLAAEKSTDPVEPHAPLGDRGCMAYSGTLVTFGQGTGLVVATGEQSEIGRISTLLAQVEVLNTPLTRQMSQFASRLSMAILAIALFAALFGILVHDNSLEEMFLAAVGLAVAAIPEGLPAIITITLAIGVQRMAGRNAIIRRLPAVETLGSVNVICSDKTGTLTRNEMMVQSLVFAEASLDVEGSGYDPRGGFVDREGTPWDPAHPLLSTCCRAVVLCNDATMTEKEGRWQLHGDPMEGALVVLGMKGGYDPSQLAEQMPRTDVIPFESEHRFMATLHHDHSGRGCIYIKGASETILPRCTNQYSADGPQPIDPLFWDAQTETIAARGQRTLAIAMRPTDAQQRVLNFQDVEGDLTLLGLMGIVDPPRSEAIEAIARCYTAGIQVKMITGDHATTARAIAKSMGIRDADTSLTGAELESMDEERLRERVRDSNIFARTSPEQKLRLVKALQQDGLVVAMTGDGVNDAPALKRADIGVAMGIKGSETAKESAEMVLADDNFASIVKAIEEGRTVYDNIKKSILFILPTNGGEALTILAAIAFGQLLPVTAAQILWVNMITAVTLALSLAFEPAEANIMQRRPRDARDSLLSPFMVWRILYVSVLMVLATFGLFIWEHNAGASIETARTVAVNTLVVAEIFYLLNARYIIASVLNRDGLLGSRYVLLAILIVSLFQMLYTYLPLMQLFFHSAPLPIESWLRIIAAGVLLFFLVELEKHVVRRFFQ